MELVKPHKCSRCEFSTESKSRLKNHVAAIHDKQKPYGCTLCDFKAASNFTLKNHIRSKHEKEPVKFNCTMCAFTTEIKNRLPAHIAAVHEKIKMEFCTQCDYSCKAHRKQHMKNHFLAKHANVKPYKCPTCGDSFTELSNMRKHMRSKFAHRNMKINVIY